MVICANYEKGFVGQYKLSIFSRERINNIQNSTDLIKLSYNQQVKGVWSKSTAGGSSAELTFFVNPS